MTFAHYTVREYLDSNHTLIATSGHRTVGGGNPKDRLLEITFSEAQRIEPNELWELGKDKLVIRAVDSRFNAYCVVSALLSLHQSPNRICQEDKLKALAIDLLDPSMPHFPTMESAAFAIRRATPLLSTRKNVDEKLFCFWRVEWHPETKPELKHLYYLLLLTQWNSECLPLAKTFLQGKDLRSLLRAQVCFSRGRSGFSGGIGRSPYSFKGSFIEIFAQQGPMWVDAFKFLIEVGAGLFDPSIALLLYISGHDHRVQADYKDSCPL